jgi:hypothetical protein
VLYSPQKFFIQWCGMQRNQVVAKDLQLDMKCKLNLDVIVQFLNVTLGAPEGLSCCSNFDPV